MNPNDGFNEEIVKLAATPFIMVSAVVVGVSLIAILTFYFVRFLFRRRARKLDLS